MRVRIQKGSNFDQPLEPSFVSSYAKASEGRENYGVVSHFPVFSITTIDKIYISDKM